MAEIGTKVIFEDDEIKVWNLILDPGEASGMHTHNHDYFYYVVEGSELEIHREDGTVGYRGDDAGRCRGRQGRLQARRPQYRRHPIPQRPRRGQRELISAGCLRPYP